MNAFDHYFSVPLPPVSVKRPGEDPNSILQRVFKHREFRSIQNDIVANACLGLDTFALMTTGGGKSLCYQIPALHFDGMTIVISPLVSLMKDQVDALRQKGVRATALNSNLSQSETEEALRAVSEGTIDLLYVAPERLFVSSFLSLLERSPSRVSSIVVDESHVIVSWGRDFRESYLRIGDFIDLFPTAVVMAVTATAGPDDVLEIINRLHIPEARVFATSFDRPNIDIVIDMERDESDLCEVLASRDGGSAIVFCATKKKVDELSSRLRGLGVPAIPYHAGLDPDVKSSNQKRFLEEDGQVVVATVAFGMGIDKSDVRLVVHLHVPGAVEDWYQEIGRAGRDGLPSRAVTLAKGASLGSSMRPIIEEIEKAGDDHERLNMLFRKLTRLQTMWGFIEGPECRRRTFLCLMGEQHPGECGNCDRCNHPVAKIDVTADARLLVKAVAATGHCYGLGYLTEVLQGIPTERVCLNKHNELGVFGKGRHLSRRDWASLYRRMLVSGDLQTSTSGSVVLTSAGWRVLQGRSSVYVAGEALESSPADSSVRRTAGLTSRVGGMLDRLLEVRERGDAASLISDRDIELLVASRPSDIDQISDLLPSLANGDSDLAAQILVALTSTEPQTDADANIASVSLF